MLSFNEGWYLNAYPHVQAEIAAGRWSHALAHYEHEGAQKGCSPNAFFDEAWYRVAYPDVRNAIDAGAIRSGYWHYVSVGSQEERSPNAWFDERWYRFAYPEIAEAIRAGTFDCAYQHYLADGLREGRAPNAFVWDSQRRTDIQRTGYGEWIEAAVRLRRTRYPAKRELGLISLVTSAYNTPVEFLQVLADSVLSQDFGVGTVFDWVIVDNGSTDSATIAALNALSLKRGVRFYRVEQNLGIMGGMRFGVQRATGRYIVPVDSDDYLRPDAVRILAWYIKAYGYPELLYSDEDKIENGEFFEAYFKPRWDPVLFVHSCYIAHLCAIDRGLATILGAYSDDRSRGCHDWDTFMRFFLAGYEPVHVPEVLYSWRRHSGSCAGDIASKDYIHSSHRITLQRFLNAASASEYYQLNYSPLFQRTPDWRIERHRSTLPRLLTLVLTQPGDDVNLAAYRSAPNCEVLALSVDGSVESATTLLRSRHAESGLVRLVSSAANALFDDWQAEAVTFFELFPDTVMVGGPVYDEGERVLTGGLSFGFNDACGCPDRMRVRQDPGYFAQMWKPHSVSAVSAHHMVVDGCFLLDALLSGRIPAEIPFHCLGEWLGAVASRWQKRVVYSPFLGVRSRVDWQGRWNLTEISRFVRANGDLIPDERFYSRHLGLSLEDAYLPVLKERRTIPTSPPAVALASKGGSA